MGGVAHPVKSKSEHQKHVKLKSENKNNYQIVYMGRVAQPKLQHDDSQVMEFVEIFAKIFVQIFHKYSVLILLT